MNPLGPEVGLFPIDAIRSNKIGIWGMGIWGEGEWAAKMFKLESSVKVLSMTAPGCRFYQQNIAMKLDEQRYSLYLPLVLILCLTAVIISYITILYNVFWSGG